MARRKYKSLEEIWDSNREKLLVMVLDARGLATPKGVEGVFCQLTMGSIKYKTKTPKRPGATPSWDEIFFFDKLADKLTIQLYGKTMLSSTFMGQIVLPTPAKVLAAEEIVDRWYDLVPREGKAKDKDNVAGKLHLRFYYSTMTETRPPSVSGNTFEYEQYEGAFKTGDLLVYSGTGIISAVTKVLTNSPYSTLGIIVELPSRWTRKPELYVVEVTRNVDGLLDVFTDDKRGGIFAFRLDERIHQFHGSKIWWSPRKAAMIAANSEAMLAYIKGARRGEQAVSEEGSADEAVMGFLSSKFDISSSHLKGNMFEAFNAEFAARCLKAAGDLPAGLDPGRASPLDLVNLECYFDPVLLRHLAAPRSARPGSLMAAPSYPLSPPDMARRSASAVDAAPQVDAAQAMAAVQHSSSVPALSPEDMAAAAASAAGLMSAPQAQFSPSSQLRGKESFYQRRMALQKAHAKPFAHSDTRRAEKVFAGGASLATYVRTADWRNNEEVPPEPSSAPP